MNVNRLSLLDKARFSLFNVFMTDPASPEEIRKRFNALMEAKGMKAAQLARICGVTPQSIQEIMEEGFTRPRISNIVKYAEALGATPQYLLFAIEGPSFYKIPSLKWEEVLIWPTWTDTDKHQKKEKEFVYMDKEGYSHCYALTVSDDLMSSSDPKERSYSAGEIIIVDPTLSAQNDDLVIAHEKGASLPILRKYLIAGLKHYLITYKALPPIEINDNIKIYGVVRGKHLGTNIEVTIENRPSPS